MTKQEIVELLTKSLGRAPTEQEITAQRVEHLKAPGVQGAKELWARIHLADATASQARPELIPGRRITVIDWHCHESPQVGGMMTA